MIRRRIFSRVTRSRLAVPCAALLLAGILSHAARAFSDDLFVSGFVSQGYLKTTEYDFLVEKSTRGTAEFNEVGISLMMDPADKLRIGVQLFAKDLGEIGNNQVRVDWAFGDYRWRDWLGVRAGKIKLPMGLYNIGRDIDMLRTPVFLPQSVYSTQWRDFTLAHEGFSLYGSVDLSSTGSLDYEVFAGALNIVDPNQSFWKVQFANQAAFELDANPINNNDTLDVDFVSLDELDVSFPWIAGGSIYWNTPLNGLRFGAHVNSGEYDMRYTVLARVNHLDPASGEVLRDELDAAATHWNERYTISVISLEYVWRDFIFSAEQFTFDQQRNHISRGRYAMLTWEPSPDWSLSGYVSEQIGNIDDPEGDNYVALGLPDFVAWQNEAVVAARVNITPNWLVKGEFHAIDGVTQVLYLDAIESVSRYWTLFAVKTTFHF